MARDNVSLEVFWVRDAAREDTANVSPPGVIAAGMVEDLRSVQAELVEITPSPADTGGEADG